MKVEAHAGVIRYHGRIMAGEAGRGVYCPGGVEPSFVMAPAGVLGLLLTGGPAIPSYRRGF